MNLTELTDRGQAALAGGRTIEALFFLGSVWMLSPESPVLEGDLQRCLQKGGNLSALSNLSRLQTVELEDGSSQVVSAWAVGTALFARQHAQNGSPWAAIDTLLTLFRHDPSLPLLERGVRWLTQTDTEELESEDVMILRLAGVLSWGVLPLPYPLAPQDPARRSLLALLALVGEVERGGKETQLQSDILASAILIRLHRIPEAIHRAARALQRKKTVETLACLGQAYQAASQHEPALRTFQSAADLALRQGLDPCPHWENAADSARFLRRYPEASYLYRLVLTRRPNNVRVAAYARFTEMATLQPTVGSPWDYHPQSL